MFSAELSSGQAGGSSTRVRLLGTLSLPVVWPAGLVENDQRMRAARDRTADLVDVLLHGVGVGVRHDEGDAGIASGTNRTEQIGVFVALVLRLARSRALLRPLVDEAVLLSDAHLILEPHLDRRGGRKLLQRLGDSGGEVFLNVAIACASCAGCRGRALMCE